MEKAIDDYRNEMDDIRRFAREVLRVSKPGSKVIGVICNKLFWFFQHWAANTGVKNIPTDAIFGKQIRKAFPTVERKRLGEKYANESELTVDQQEQREHERARRPWIYEGIEFSATYIFGESTSAAECQKEVSEDLTF
jgi:phage/plasmid-associated DNA primase